MGCLGKHWSRRPTQDLHFELHWLAGRFDRLPRPMCDAFGLCVVPVESVGMQVGLGVVFDDVDQAQGDVTTDGLVDRPNRCTYSGFGTIDANGIGLLGAVLYAYSFVFFTSTVVFALFGASRDWSAVTATFGAWLTVHGALMVIGGLDFGWAVWRARVFPVWTGPCLAVGVVLVAAASGLPIVVRTGAAAVPDAAFIGMGWAVLRQVVTAGVRCPATSGEDGNRTQSANRG
jgi:hypothetical protein